MPPQPLSSRTLPNQVHLSQFVATWAMLFIGTQLLVSLESLAVLLIDCLDKLCVAVAISSSTLVQGHTASQEVSMPGLANQDSFPAVTRSAH